MRATTFAVSCFTICFLFALVACDDGTDTTSPPTSSTSGTAGTGGSGGSGGGTSVGGGGDGGGGGGEPACLCDPEAYAEQAMTSGVQLFNGVTLTESTPMINILLSPATYEGQVVRIEGFTVEICQTQGCYITLEDCYGNHLNLKVTDGVLDFRDYVVLGNYVIGEGISQQAGEHGAQIYIQDHGAMVGSDVCAGYAGG